MTKAKEKVKVNAWKKLLLEGVGKAEPEAKVRAKLIPRSSRKHRLSLQFEPKLGRGDCGGKPSGKGNGIYIERKWREGRSAAGGGEGQII